MVFRRAPSHFHFFGSLSLIHLTNHTDLAALPRMSRQQRRQHDESRYKQLAPLGGVSFEPQVIFYIYSRGVANDDKTKVLSHFTSQCISIHLEGEESKAATVTQPNQGCRPFLSVSNFDSRHYCASFFLPGPAVHLCHVIGTAISISAVALSTFSAATDSQLPVCGLTGVPGRRDVVHRLTKSFVVGGKSEKKMNERVDEPVVSSCCAFAETKQLARRA